MLLLGEAVLGSLLLAAAVFDWKRRKIPNALILAGWFFSLSFGFLQAGMGGVLRSAITIIVVLAAGFFLFSIRVVGAGDIKLCSVISGMQGMVSGIDILAVSVLLAGAWSFARLLKKRMLAERLLYAWSYFTAGGACRGPYDNKSRDGTDCTILLAPFMAAGYFLVLLGRWGGM